MEHIEDLHRVMSRMLGTFEVKNRLRQWRKISKHAQDHLGSPLHDFKSHNYDFSNDAPKIGYIGGLAHAFKIQKYDGSSHAPSLEGGPIRSKGKKWLIHELKDPKSSKIKVGETRRIIPKVIIINLETMCSRERMDNAGAWEKQI